MNKANSRRIILLSLALAFAIPIVAQMQNTSVVINAPMQLEARPRTKPPQTKIPQVETPKISPELEAKLVALLKTTGKEAASLNLTENRIRYLSDTADLLWIHDEKTARDLFANAANDLRSSVQSLDTFYQRREAGEIEEDSLGGMFFGGGGGSESRKSYTVNAVRQNLLLTLAKRDGSAALALFRETERPNSKEYNWNDQQLEAKLGTIIAKNDPARALEIGMRKLSKNDFEGIDDLVANLYRKDAGKGAQLAAETVRKLKTAESPMMIYGRDSSNALFDKATEITDEVGKTNADKPPMLSEGDLRELAETIVKKRIKRVKQDRYAYYDEFDTSERLKKYAPASYAQLESEIKAVSTSSSANSSMGNMRGANYATGANSSMSNTMTNGYAIVTTTNSNTTIGISARESAEQAQAAAVSELMEAAKSPDAKISLEAARKNLSVIRSRQQRLLALTQIAKVLIARGDKDSAKSLLADAADMQVAQPRKAMEMLQNLMLADAYSGIEPDRSFTIMESTIFEFNSVAAALGRMVEFADIKEVADGEFNMGILPKEATQALGTFGLRQPLLNLANADFERTAALADKFDKSELRMEAKMLVIRTLLPPEKD